MFDLLASGRRTRFRLIWFLVDWDNAHYWCKLIPNMKIVLSPYHGFNWCTVSLLWKMRWRPDRLSTGPLAFVPRSWVLDDENTHTIQITDLIVLRTAFWTVLGTEGEFVLENAAERGWFVLVGGLGGGGGRRAMVLDEWYVSLGLRFVGYWGVVVDTFRMLVDGFWEISFEMFDSDSVVPMVLDGSVEVFGGSMRGDDNPRTVKLVRRSRSFMMADFLSSWLNESILKGCSKNCDARWD